MMEVAHMFMSDVLQQDLKKFVEFFWKRDDLDIRDFNMYKGFAYVLMQMYKKPDYQERKNELMSYMEHGFDDWKFYFLNLMIELMREDSNILDGSKSNLPVCKFKSDMPDAINQIKRYHNAFILAGDYATDIYQDTIKRYKDVRKRKIIERLYGHYEDPEDLYDRFELHEDILNAFYKTVRKSQLPDTSKIPIEVKRAYLCKPCKYSWQTYILWLEYVEDKKAFIDKYDSIQRQTERKIKNDLIERLRIVHKLMLSHTYDEVKIIKTFDRDTAYELGCSSEEYLSSDWESEVKFDDNFDKFLSNCMLDKCIYYKFVICDNGKIFDFTLANKE